MLLPWLRNRKAEVDEQLRGKRFEVAPAIATAVNEAPSVLDESAKSKTISKRLVAAQQPEAGLAPEAEQDDDSYTSRLLKAQKKVWEEEGSRGLAAQRLSLRDAGARPTGGQAASATKIQQRTMN